MVAFKCALFCCLFIVFHVEAYLNGDLQNKRTKVLKTLAAAIGETEDPMFQRRTPPTWADIAAEIAAGKLQYSPNNPSTTYEQVGPNKPSYADVLFNPSVSNQFVFNHPNDQGINRLSHEGIYPVLPDGLPLNPSGPTGVGDRGSNGKYGVNHCGDAVVVRFICDDSAANRSRIDCFQALVNTRRDGRKGFPGGLLNVLELLEACVFRELREENMNLEGKKFLQAKLRIFIQIAKIMDNGEKDTVKLAKTLQEFIDFLHKDKKTAEDEFKSARRAISRAATQLTRTDLSPDEWQKQVNARKEGEDRLLLATTTIGQIEDYLAKLTACMKEGTAGDSILILREMYPVYTRLILNEIKEKAHKGINFHKRAADRLKMLRNNGVPVDDRIIKEHEASIQKFDIRLLSVNIKVSLFSAISISAMLKTLSECLAQVDEEVKVLVREDFLDKFPLKSRLTLHFGYVDDENQADRAWREAYARLLPLSRDTQTFLSDHWEHGDDAKDMEWLTIMRDMELIASHPIYSNKVADKIENGEFFTFSMPPAPMSHYVQVGIKGEADMAMEPEDAVKSRYDEIKGIPLQLPMIKPDDLARLAELANTDSSYKFVFEQQQQLRRTGGPSTKA